MTLRVAHAQRDVARAALQARQATREIAKEYRLVHAGWGEVYGLDGVGDDTIHPHQTSSDVIAGLLIAAVDEATAKDTRGEFQWSFENWAGNHF